jgi:hypothetical protein
MSLEDENNLLKMQITELKNLIVNLCLEDRCSHLPKPTATKTQSAAAVKL